MSGTKTTKLKYMLLCCLNNLTCTCVVSMFPCKFKGNLFLRIQNEISSEQNKQNTKIRAARQHRSKAEGDSMYLYKYIDYK